MRGCLPAGGIPGLSKVTWHSESGPPLRFGEGGGCGEGRGCVRAYSAGRAGCLGLPRPEGSGGGEREGALSFVCNGQNYKPHGALRQAAPPGSKEGEVDGDVYIRVPRSAFSGMKISRMAHVLQ